MCTTTNDASNTFRTTTNDATDTMCTTTNDASNTFRTTTNYATDANASIRFKLLFNVHSITIGGSTNASTIYTSNAYRSTTNT
jgi:hypothetical protein